MDVVCDALAGSSRSVASILAEGYQGHAMPLFSVMSRWLTEEGDEAQALRNQYARAKEAQADYMAEELAELHNKAWVPVLSDDGRVLMDGAGKPLMTVDKASAAVVRLEADNKKWLMSKLRPKKYGDKLELDGKLQHDHHHTMDPEQARRMAAMLLKGAPEGP